MSTWALYLLLLKATALSFSGFASVPVLREDLVENRQVLTDEQLSNAIAMSQASPGPLGLYIVAVGYFVGGVSGAVAAALALASPAILALPIAQVVRRGSDSHLRGAYKAIVITSCVLIMTTGGRLASEAAPSLSLMFLAGVAFIVLSRTRVPPIALIFACAGVVHLLP